MKMKKPDAIRQLLTDVVEYLPAATNAFRDLIAAEAAARPPIQAHLSSIEKDADEGYVKLVRKVADTFITPYDREDLYAMAEALDDAVDALDHAGRLVIGFGMEALPATLLASTDELVKMSETARDAVAWVKKPKRLEKLLFELNEHENHLDFSYRQLLCEELVDGADPIRAIKVKILADLVEDVSTRIDEFVRTLSIAAIKET